ncbi:MAG TPA: hypothetical protein VJ279_08440 [Hanamia sp.]|jgi:hypothetical protein|nr:hypothetical protein [Hanamia sp.]
MSFWDSFKNSPVNPLYMYQRDDPQADANKYLNQIPDIGKQYFNPFIERGKAAGDTLEGQYGKLLNPSSFIDDLMKNYSLSKGATYERDQLGKGIGATAAAGGFAGTPEHQREYGEMADNIMSRDMQQYLQNALGVYNTGLSGEQGFYGTGFDASSALADILGGQKSSQAGLAFQAGTQRNTDRQALFNAIAKIFAQGAGAGA